MKYAIGMGSVVMIYIPSSLKNWFRHLNWSEGIQTHRKNGDLISLILFFFQNEDSRLIKKEFLSQRHSSKNSNEIEVFFFAPGSGTP
jgi:hypothetical protein